MNAKALQKQLVAAVAMLLVAAIALGSSTYAWFVNNTKVTAQYTNISSATSTSSLYIKNKSTAGIPTSDLTSVTTAAGSNTLYPVSLDNSTPSGNMASWYIANEWADTSAKNYTLLGADNSFTPTTGDGTFSIGSKTYAAYNVTDYVIYSKNGTQKVYLDPENPITVVDSTNKSGLIAAVRIAVVAGDNVVYYLPVQESGTGNSQGSASGKVYWVASTATIAEQTIGTSVWDPTVIKSSKWCAIKQTDGTYLDTGKTSLGNATNLVQDEDSELVTGGLDVKIYVWLEGTDAQCMIGDADNRTGLSITANFVGVASTT